MGRVKRNGNNKICLTSSKAQMDKPLTYVGYDGIFYGSGVLWNLHWSDGVSPYSVMHGGLGAPVSTTNLLYSYDTFWDIGFGDYSVDYTVTDKIGQQISGNIYIQVI